MMKPVSPVVGDGLHNVEELFLHGKMVVIILLADDGRLGVQSTLEELGDIRWWCHYFLGAGHCPKSTKMMARRAKAFAIARWAFLSAMETFVKSRANTTAEMHFTVKAGLSSNFSSIG
jgi:hypothetical protein